MSENNWTINNIPDLKGKVIIVTGGNSGLGFESVKAFAKKGADVILASRSLEKGNLARTEIVNEYPDSRIEVMELDLGDLESVRNFADKFSKKYKKLDILLNNAGIMMTPYLKTKDGFEGQLGTNHLGHFALTGLLLDKILNSPGSRVINVSSMAHKSGKMDFNNLQFENGKGYSPMKSYGRSKLSNLLFIYELQRRLESSNHSSIAIAAHPGVATTNLSRYLENKLFYKLLYPVFKNISQDQAMGALPQIKQQQTRF